MKVEKINSVDRDLVGYICGDGSFILKFKSSLCPDENAAWINDHGVTTIMSSTVEETFNPKRDTPIYKGDTISITF